MPQPLATANDHGLQGASISRLPERRFTLKYGIFFDGTGNDKDTFDEITSGPSNIAKLYWSFLFDPNPDQKGIIWDREYIHGVGSQEDDLLGLGFAKGFDWRLEFHLKKLQERRADYQKPLIQLYIFGFSRGAAAARAFVNALHDPRVQEKYDLPEVDNKTDQQDESFRGISIELLSIFDTVGAIGVPGNGWDFGYDLRVWKSRVKNVIHLIAQSEVRRNFDLWSIRCPPIQGIQRMDAPSSHATDSYLKYLPAIKGEGPYEMKPEDWIAQSERKILPNTSWEEWILPGMHSDVGGGYACVEWIPELGEIHAKPGESINEFAYRIFKMRIKRGASFRGSFRNPPKPRETIAKSTKEWAQKNNSDVPDLHTIDDSISRMSYWVMRNRIDLALRENVFNTLAPFEIKSQPPFRPSASGKKLEFLQSRFYCARPKTVLAADPQWKSEHPISTDNRGNLDHLRALEALPFWNENIHPREVEMRLFVDNPDFRTLVIRAMHDSRWAATVDLWNLKRSVYFGGVAA